MGFEKAGVIKHLLAISALLFFTGCAHLPEPRIWTTEEKVLLGTAWGASAWEGYTTIRFLNNDGNHEMNPGLGPHPSAGKVVVVTIASNLIITGIVHFVPCLRKPVLTIKTFINLGFGIHNSTLDW